jgi:hypothetical protein
VEEPVMMKTKLLTACLLTGLLAPALASANPEPTAYDTRSIGMGLTGTTFLDQPAALVMNPANLEGIGKIGFTVNMTNLLLNQRAPVQGPNTTVDSGLGYGPLASGFIAGRIAPRVVFGRAMARPSTRCSASTAMWSLRTHPINPLAAVTTCPTPIRRPAPTARLRTWT